MVALEKISQSMDMYFFGYVAVPTKDIFSFIGDLVRIIMVIIIPKISHRLTISKIAQNIILHLIKMLIDL